MKRYMFFGPAGVLCLLILNISCDPIQRHKVLTFFFDGVPPLGGESNVADPNSISADGGDGSQEQEEKSYLHEPYLTCKTAPCHDMSKPPMTLVRRFPLLTKPPDLCYDCHADKNYANSPNIVHGPAAVKKCLLCHEAHLSKNKYLLKKPVPELCFSCHNIEDVRMIENHSLESYSSCSNCHEGHSSVQKGLLKEGWKEKD